jgi:carbamoyltransferase
MKILGLSGGLRQGYQDISATLVVDGKVIYAIEEERLNRIKFSPGKFPLLSVKNILKASKLEMRDIDKITFHGSTWGDHIDAKIKSFYENNFGYCPPIERFHHHECHAASTFFASEFDEALVVTADNSGDGISLQIALGKGRDIQIVERFSRPTSFGLFYQIITQICGYTKDSDEYKVMGLSSWGDKNAFDLRDVLYFEEGNLVLNPMYINAPKPGEPSLHKDELTYNARFEDKIGLKRRLIDQDLSDDYKNLAASAQKRLEEVFVELITFYLNKFGLSKVCLAGGVALNCVLNQKLMNRSEIEDLFIQPASSDAGISLGSAWLGARNFGEPIEVPQNYYLGFEYSDETIESILKNCGIRYERKLNIAKLAAELLRDGKVIGWFQGRSEFGPRALGNRSILANPMINGMQNYVNKKIKFRESFRPFAPSLLEEDLGLYFMGRKTNSPFMTITFESTPFAKTYVPEVVHVDGTSRIQTVNPLQNILFYQLISEFKELTGHGVLMNTSFNLSHEPIVESPRDAVASFYASGLDALLIGDFYVAK